MSAVDDRRPRWKQRRSPAPAPCTTMKSDLRSLRSLGALFWAGIGLTLVAQEPTLPPGVPEPGLVVWGQVVRATDPARTVSIASVSWSVTDGTQVALLTTGSRPAVRIRTLAGQSYYVLEVPFATRTFGAIALAEPTPASFELKASAAPVLTLLATVNGQPASVHAIDRHPASGAEVVLGGLARAERGRVVRVDLAIQADTDPYESWAAAIWGNAALPEAAPDADPDGDGLNNRSEYEAGTAPTDPASALRLLTLAVDRATRDVTVQWLSANDRRYQLEAAAHVNGPWHEVGEAVPGAGDTTQARLPGQAAESHTFYRVRLAP